MKVAVIGDLAVGKTAICNRFVNNDFKENSPTIGVGCYKKMEVINDQQFEILIDDTPGSQELDQVTNTLIRGKDLIIIVYDLTKKSHTKLLSNVSKEQKASVQVE